jgi:flagellar motor switch protein FliN/FliY
MSENENFEMPPEMAEMAANAPSGLSQATAGANPAQADFDELQGQAGRNDPASLSVLYDLALPVTIELGRARMSVEEVLSLGRGSVIQLDRLAGEPIDVLVGDRHFAEGEVVVVGEQFGVRITRITAPGPQG